MKNVLSFLAVLYLSPISGNADSPLITLTRWYGDYPCLSIKDPFGTPVTAHVGPTGIRIDRPSGSIQISVNELASPDKGEREQLALKASAVVFKTTTDKPAFIVFDSETERFFYNAEPVIICGKYQIK